MSYKRCCKCIITYHIDNLVEVLDDNLDIDCGEQETKIGNKNIIRHCKKCNINLCPKCVYSVKKGFPHFSDKRDIYKAIIACCNRCDGTYCKSCFKEHSNTFIKTCFQCNKYECSHVVKKVNKCLYNDCDHTLCDSCFIKYKETVDICSKCNSSQCYLDLSTMHKCHKCCKYICKKCKNNCESCNNIFCVDCYKEHQIDEVSRTTCVLCDHEWCKDTVCNKLSKHNVDYCKECHIIIPLNMINKKEAYTPYGDIFTVNKAFIPHRINDYPHKKKNKPLVPYICHIKGCNNSSKDTLLTCMYQKIICIDHAKIIKNYKSFNNEFYETKHNKLCRINKEIYAVESTSKCYMCKHYYYINNMIYQTNKTLKPLIKRNNTCRNCYNKICTIQRFIIYHIYNPKYKICRNILNKKYNKLDIK